MKSFIVILIFLVSQTTFAAANITCKATATPAITTPPNNQTPDPTPIDITFETATLVGAYKIWIQADSFTDDAVAIQVTDNSTGKVTEAFVKVKPQDVQLRSQNEVISVKNAMARGESFPAALVIFCYTPAP